MKKLLPLFLLLFVLSTFSCGDKNINEPEAPVDNFDRRALLTDVADGIIIPGFEAYVTKLKALNGSAQSFAMDPSKENLDVVRSNWLEAYTSWQYVSMFNIGKAEEISLRNFTNIFPTNTVEIEDNILTNDFNFNLPSKNDEQGFPALDYMLYGMDGNDEKIVNKYEDESYKIYLTALTQKLEDMGITVLEDWKNGYREDFINNDGSSATSSLNKMVNDFIFYYERFLRAGKIGIPAGVFSGTTLPDKVEGYYAKVVSKDLFLASLDAAQRFFKGTNFNSESDGTSLEDYLDYLNNIKEGANLSKLINDQFNASRLQAENLNDNFSQQIEMENIKMLETYDELQKNVIYLKVDMLQALNIKVDFVDADGD